MAKVFMWRMASSRISRILFFIYLIDFLIKKTEMIMVNEQ